MRLASPEARRRRNMRGSFSLWDLGVISVVVIFLGAWFLFAHTGERGRIIRCTGNFNALGEATRAFADDHDDSLPAAAIDLTYLGGGITSWDTQLAPYLEPRLRKAKSVYEEHLLWPGSQHHLFCPSDPIERPNPRSYAMSWRRWLYGWPPAPQDLAGVGMMWNQATISKFLDEALAKKAVEHPDLLPRVKRSVAPDPAHTLLYTEYIAPGNIMGRGICSHVGSVRAQQEAFNGDSSRFHFGKFNYLMLDGHVELLSAPQTEGSDGKSHNIWTINPDD
jgi:prepilin-type processing-associated H-X9-DG protein